MIYDFLIICLIEPFRLEEQDFRSKKLVYHQRIELVRIQDIYQSDKPLFNNWSDKVAYSNCV